MDDETVTCITAEAGTKKASTQVHPDFKPVQDLRISDLPQGWRCREALDVIGHVSQRVVMIYIPRMSSERPESIFSESPHFGGTGFAYYIDRHIVKVRTNLHVIYNAEEAARATVQFSLHVRGKRHARVVRLRGWGRNFFHNSREDFSSFACPPSRRLLRYLDVFRHVPVLWDAAFFASTDSEGSCCAGTDGEDGAAETATTATTAADDDDDDDDDGDDDDDDDDASAPSLIHSRVGAKRSRVRGDDGVLHGGKRSRRRTHLERMISWEVYDGETSLEGGYRTAEPREDLWSGSTVDDDRDDRRGAQERQSGFDTAVRREAERRVSDCEEENGYVSDIDSGSAESWNQCRRPTLENGDYIAILSHPQGLEKCFSMGPAALYDPEALEKQRNNFRKCRTLSGTHAGHPAVHLLNDRFKVCKNRIYHAESTFGCSGAPVLLFKRSLRRIRIPVVDYSQHSGTCFFKSGEKLGFATCFTPAVFSQSARACEDLQQCYSVIRKQERLSRQEERLHSKRFETPGSCAAESTHILNTDRARGRTRCLYKVKRGAIVREWMRSSEDASHSVKSPVPPLSRSIVSTGATRTPAQFSHTAFCSRAGVQAERHGKGRSSYASEQKSNSLGRICPWKERNSMGGCDSASLADLNYEDTRGTRSEDTVESKSFSCFNDARQQTMDDRRHVLEHLNSSNQCLHGLQSSSGYISHRKNPGRFSALTFQARDTGADQNPEVWVSTQKQNVLAESEHESVDQETWEEDSLISDCFSNLTMSSDDSESGSSYDSSEKALLDVNNVPIENTDPSFCFPAISTDSDDCARGVCNKATVGVQTEEDMSTLTHLGSSDCGTVSAVLKRENETVFKSGRVDRTCISQRGTHCNTVNQLSVYSHQHTLTEDSECSWDSALSSSHPSDDCVIDKNAQNQTSILDVQEHLGVSGKEKETATHFAEWESSPMPRRKIVDDFASEIKEHHHPVSENGCEHKTDLFSVPVDRIHSITSLACSETSDNPTQQWNNILNTEIASGCFVNAGGLSEPTSHSIPDQPEPSSKKPISPVVTTERTEIAISEATEVLHDSGMCHQPVGDYVSFPLSSMDHFGSAEGGKAVDGTDQDHLSKSTLEADLELITDHTLHREPCPSDSNVSSSDESPVGMQSKSNTDHESLLSNVSSLDESPVGMQSKSNTDHESLLSNVSSSDESPVGMQSKSNTDHESLLSNVSSSDESPVGMQSKSNTDHESLLSNVSSSDESPVGMQSKSNTDHESLLSNVSSSDESPVGMQSKSNTDHESLLSNVSSSDESPVGMQSKSNTDHESLLRDQAIYEQNYQSGIQERGEERFMEGNFGGSLVQSFLVEMEDGDLRAAQSIPLNEGCSQDDSFSVKSHESLSPEKFDGSSRQDVSEDSTLSGKLKSFHVESDRTEGSYHSPLELPRPRSAYSLHTLKVLEHKRKKMREEMQKGTSQFGTGERSNNGAREKQTSLGLQEMAGRFLKMESPYIDSSTGKTSRYMHLNNIKHLLSEIRNQLVPNGGRMSNQFNQLWTSEPQTYTPPSCGPAKANQTYVQSIDTKESKLTIYPYAQRTDPLYEQRYKHFPLFVHRKIVPASEVIVDNAIENDSYANGLRLQIQKQDSNAFRSTRNTFDPIVGSHKNSHQGLTSGLNVHPRTAQPVIQPQCKPADYGFFAPAVAKPSSTDAHLKSRLARHSDRHGDLYNAQSCPWLYGPADKMTWSPSAPVNTQGVENGSPWATYLPRSGLCFDAGAFDRGETVNSSRLKSAEPPIFVPRASSFLPGYTRMLARDNSGFSEKCATADRNIFGCPDLPYASTSSSQYGVASSGCLRKNTELSQYQMCGSSARNNIPANAIISHQKWLPTKGLNFGQRDGYPGNPPGWAIVQTDPVWDLQFGPSRLGSTHIKQHSDAFRGHHSDQTGDHSSHSFPKTRPDESSFRHNPFPCSLSTADLLTKEWRNMDGGMAEYVHYQHESAKFDGSLGSSPVVPSSTDSSSFHSSPELPLSKTDTVPASSEQLTSGAEALDLLTPWSTSRRAESKPTSVPRSAAQCNPVKWKAGCAHHGLTDTPRKLEAKRNAPVSMMKRNEAKPVVPSLSKAFERFLSSDVEDEDGLDSEGECWWEDGNRSRPKPWTAGSSVRNTREARSTGDSLWIDTGDTCHRPAHSLSQFSGFNGIAVGEVARYSPLLKIKTDISPERTDLESGFRSESTLSTAFNRFFDIHSEVGTEVPTAKNAYLSSETHKSLPKSSKPSGCTEDRDRQNERHMYDVNDIVQVVLEMGVLVHEAPADSESKGPVSPDDPQCNLYEPPPEMFSSSAYKCNSATRNEYIACKTRHPKSDSTCPSQEKIGKGKSSLQKQNGGVKPLQVVKTLQVEIVDMGYSSSTSECSDDCVSRPKARQKTRHQERHRAVSDPQGKSASGSTHTSQQSTESSSALRRHLPRKTRQADNASRKSVLSLHGAHHRESRLHECKPFTLHQTAWRPVSAEEPGLPNSPQWHHFNTKPSSHEASPPLGWTWNGNGPYAPFCGCRYCMHWQFRNPTPGCYTPFLQPPACLHGCCTCEHFNGRNRAFCAIHAVPSFFGPEADQHWATGEACLKGSEPSSKQLDDSRLAWGDPSGKEAYSEYACIPTVDVVDMAFRATLVDVGIIRAQFSEDSEEQEDSAAKARMPQKSSGGTADPQHEHGSSGTASRPGGKYVKNRKTRRSGKANRYSRRGKDKADDKDPARRKARNLPRPPGDEKREASSDRSATSLTKDLARVLQCGRLSSDSGSEKSRHGVHYVTVPGDIRVRLEKAAKWIITQVFVCPEFHFLTPRDAGVFARQQNLHLTLHTMTLFD